MTSDDKLNHWEYQTRRYTQDIDDAYNDLLHRIMDDMNWTQDEAEDFIGRNL